MKYFLILQALISFTYVRSVAQKSNLVGITKGRPVGHAVPSQVDLYIYSNIGPRGCSGSLISENYVLTSGYCIHKVKTIDVHLGVDKRSDEKEKTRVTIKAQSWMLNENFTEHMAKEGHVYTYDVGLVKLSSPAPMNEYIQPIKLSTEAPSVGSIGKVSGWGLTEFMQKSSKTLLQINVAIQSNEKCLDNNYNEEIMLCAVGVSGGGICNGDQGGPLLIEDKQVGVTSYSDYHCRKDDNIFFSRISAFLDWIVDNSDYKP